MHTSNDKARCIPILASLNLDDTAAFYERQLGFETARLGDYRSPAATRWRSTSG